MSNKTSSGAARPAAGIPRVVVLTTVMLTFISFWRAAALVLNDLASTAYYIGGIAENAIGKAAPWFILFVMLFSFCVRAVYIESCSMFVRGGVYRIVKEAMGTTMAKIAVSALVFDFVLTGPISAVSAGHYVHSFLHETLHRFHIGLPLSSDAFSIGFALLLTGYFWWLNVKGVEESSNKALKIMIITAVMVVVLDLWSVATMTVKGFHLPPFEIRLDRNSLGWLEGWDWLGGFKMAVFFIALGHTLLAMSGEEALAQVYREIEAPKHRNLIKAALVVFAFSIAFTGFTTFAAFSLVPEEVRKRAGDSLLNQLALGLIGPILLKLLMVAFIVVVGALILAGAVNTSIFASNAVLNRVAEDGILADWFRQPHPRFGTTHRIIHMIGILQVVTILISRGNVELLGEAYAFGVVWSFAFMATSMLILRFKYRGERTLKVPVNFTIKGLEIPVGLGMVCFILVGVAITNLFTKPKATVAGIAFTAALFALFLVSEVLNRRRRMLDGSIEGHTEKFMLDRRSELTPELVDIPGDHRRVLVPVRDPNNLAHLKLALELSHQEETEIVVMTVKVDRSYREHAEQRSHDEESRLLNEGGGVITNDEMVLFTRVVELAEKYGEEIRALVVPSNNAWFAIARTAKDTDADEILLGRSENVPPDVQLQQLALMWGMVATGTERELTLRIVGKPGEEFAATI